MFSFTDGPLGRDPAWLPGLPHGVWLGLAAAIGVLGAWMLARALLRRLDAGPRCRRCGYSVEGLPSVAGGRCPECGLGRDEPGRRAPKPSRTVWAGAAAVALSAACALAPAVERHGVFVLLPDRALAEIALRTPAGERFNWKAAAQAEFGRRARAGTVRAALLRSMVRRSGVLTPVEVEVRVWDTVARPGPDAAVVTRAGYHGVLRPVCGFLGLDFEFEPAVLAEVSGPVRLGPGDDPGNPGVAVSRFLAAAPGTRRRVASHTGGGCPGGSPLGPLAFRGRPPERLVVRARVIGGPGADLGWFAVDLPPRR